ncbi:hypothetical protein FACS1894219_01730 [Clostridia bacterium]|nr:hypothetical protein FACS1894219_01730 [Clostridia bacterium]
MAHKGTVTLETERLILRRFTPGDAEAMFRNWASDPEVTKYLMWQPHPDVIVTEHILNEWIPQYEKPDYYHWTIVPRDLGEPAGTIAAVRQSDDDRMVHIGYCIGKTWWRRGYMTEALTEIVRFFFEEVGVNRVESRHDPRNPNSGKVMQKAGMRYEGTSRQSDHNNQGVCDAVNYAILAEDYFTLTFAPYDLTADRDFLTAAHKETFKLTFKQEIKPEWLDAELAKPRDIRDGAYIGGKLAGICDLQRRSSESSCDYGRVNFFFIAPEHRNRGLGGQLIAHAVNWCRRQGLKMLTLNTAKDNFQAQKCYEKNGFVRFSQIDTDNEFGYVKSIAPYNIRKMTTRDYDAVYSMWLNTSGMGLNDVDDSRDGIAKFIGRNPVTNFVAERGGEIIGVIMAGHDGRRGHIHHTTVRDDCRRTGIGSALVSAATDALKAEGISKILLVAFIRNESGNAFWESQGFTARTDLTYRNKAIIELQRIDT